MDRIASTTRLNGPHIWLPSPARDSLAREGDADGRRVDGEALQHLECRCGPRLAQEFRVEAEVQS